MIRKQFRKQSRAFTIPEMLAVIAIIVIIISLLMPGIGQSRKVARMAICASNLHQVHVAFKTRRVDLVNQGEGTANEVPFGWPNAILPYLANDINALTCPEDDELGTGTASIIIECILSGSHYFDTTLNEGPLNAKLSTTQLDEADLLESKNGWTPPPYIPDENPHIYHFAIEDIRPGGGDRDFEDFIIHVEEKGDDIELVFERGGTNRRFNILAPDRTVLVQDASNQSITVEPGYASYGINGHVTGGHGADSVVMAIDYETTGVDAQSHDWDDWINEDTNQLKFARHFNGMNALWTDGSVKTTLKRNKIDPAESATNLKMWIPEN